MLYSAIKATRKDGTERFTYESEDLDIALLDFWKWSVSDLISNATRGRLAEFIVASALKVNCGVREEWAAYDLQTANGIKVEVKSAAYMQSWAQRAHSKIHFACPETQLLESEPDKQTLERKRQAEAYVFALLHHRERNSLEPLKLEQWEFYVVPTKTLNDRTSGQRSISLASLQRIARRLTYADLARDFHSLL